MKIATVSRYALALLALGTMLCGCGGSQVGSSFVSGTRNAARGASGNRTFYYTGKEQRFTVPAGVTKITVVARGAAGGESKYTNGGRGGRVYAVLPVTPGEKLFVFVGGASSGYLGGWNGGADGGIGESAPSCGSADGAGGGGASDLRRSADGLRERILVAAGGGGAGGSGENSASNPPPGAGGNGGGSSGGNGGAASDAGGGFGGTQSSGGAGGKGGAGIYPSTDGGSGKSGSLRNGGDGGTSRGYSGCDGGGGGAGGGYYGGGGGGGAGGWPSQALSGAGGGGGSSYVEVSAIKSQTWAGWKNATDNGLVVISW